MKKKAGDLYPKFDPNNHAVNNGNLIGLPFSEATAPVVLLPAPWEVTVSSGGGTLYGAANIRKASLQLDLYDEQVKDAWKLGIYFRKTDMEWHHKSQQLKPKALQYIDFLEAGGDVNFSKIHRDILAEINEASEAFNDWMYQTTSELMKRQKLVGVVGGEHSVPLGFLRALANRHKAFGILQIDAHCDLRVAYEGFFYSHASIFYNALELSQLTKLVQVGIRDYCEAERAIVDDSNGRVEIVSDIHIKQQQFEGVTFANICDAIIQKLPQKVYVSFDIDGLDPSLCPNTGTPVPGGLSFSEAMFLLHRLVSSGRTIIGFDLSEVNGVHEWDGNVGARVLYKLATLMAVSNRLT